MEDLNGKLTGIECKWSPKSKLKIPKDWREGYPTAAFELVTRENWMELLADSA